MTPTDPPGPVHRYQHRRGLYGMVRSGTWLPGRHRLGRREQTPYMKLARRAWREHLAYDRYLARQARIDAGTALDGLLVGRMILGGWL